MPSALADKIRAKFPGAYDDMDDAALEKSVLVKHPEYQDLATPAEPAWGMHPTRAQEALTADPAAAPDWKSNLAGALEPLAHPKTAADIGALLIPGGAGGATDRVLQAVGKLPLAKIGMGAAGAAYGGATAPENAGPLRIMGRMATYGAAGAMAPTALKILPAPAREAVEQFATKAGEWNSPLTAAGREGRAHAAVAEQVDRYLPSRGGMPTSATVTPSGGRVPYATPTEAPPPTMADVVKSTPGAQPYAMPTPAPAPAAEAPLLTSNGYPLPPEVEAKVRAQLTGRLQMAPTGRPPITVSPESPMQPPPESPLQQPRRAVGAEVVGRDNGMTTQQVRDATGPIRGEAPGTAAGMPSGPADRIIQKLISMGPKGQGLEETTREAYAAAGNDPKTRLQVQAYLDALRKVGYAIPLAAPTLMRGRLVSMGQEPQP